ncbi:MAG: Fe-S cluster assembly sulfur transfer protein SufU [Planctomycetota bacterium]
MTGVDELYQNLILHHGRSPRNFGTLAEPDRAAHGHNPLCGDRIHLTLALDGERIAEVRFTGDGCAIATASSSVMTDAIKGRTLEEAKALFAAFHALVAGEEPAPGPSLDPKLAAFAGVRRFPIRVKCAMLAWRTLEAALANGREAVTTE